ncbi:hypothetical protein LTR85_001236 [Meristemomyces frigidus]|nr:hypothetical protein LTR85_001236 [Meristemomyces frigidus]
MLAARPDPELQTSLVFYLGLLLSFLIVLSRCGVFSPSPLFRAALRRPTAYCTRVLAPVQLFLGGLKRDAPADGNEVIPVPPGHCPPDDEDSTYTAIWIDIRDYGRYVLYRTMRVLRLRPAPPVYIGEVKRTERARRDREATHALALAELQSEEEALEKGLRNTIAELEHEQAKERRRKNVFLHAGWL